MRALSKLTWVETKLFFREPLAVIFAFAFPFFVLFILAGVFGNEVEPEDSEDFEIWRGVGPTDYYIPAYVGLVMASVGLINMPVRLASYRERGVLRRFRAAGVPLAATVGSQVAVFLGMSIVGALVVALMGMLVYGTPAPDAPLLVVLAFLVSAAAFAGIGLFLGAVLPTARTAQGAGLALFFVMMFICGAGPPRKALSDTMQAVGEPLPLTHVILVLQDPWLGFGWNGVSSLVLAGFALVAGALGLKFFRWE